jgi:SAM-dependent methyltransferase
VRVGRGLYVGCGNGRNYLPLVDAGLDLVGLDVSPEAIEQIAARRPALAARLVCADFRDFGDPDAFAYVVALQVFQHGGDADAAGYFARVARLLRPGGLFFLRVNSASTEVWHRHTVVERHPLGGFTVRYDDGPKQDLPVHFYSRAELLARTLADFALVAEPREDVIRREPPKRGSWAQWEAIWARRRS